ncbi:unnamed protein product [Paramecium octaurelia]|uniref:Uncharacterized protein n=1 Tax=Paramecium octaurelia TaxID=43137 RepID=A0A8S1YIU0_PAROT|nr:unnamed protein product [Paramecium octaurelia]
MNLFFENSQDNTACQEAKYNCKNYTRFNKCPAQMNDLLSCIWIDSSSYSISDVNYGVITGSGLDHALFQAYNLDFESVTDIAKCQNFKSACEQYAGTPLSWTKAESSK